MAPSELHLPLVSVVTPTWQRHDQLISRCMRSVVLQSYKNIEHVIVSDGPDPVLACQAWPKNVRYAELPLHTPLNGRWGVKARLHGISMAKGNFIAYLDDDNAFRPKHVSRLMESVHWFGSDFAYSRFQRHDSHGQTGPLSGTHPPQYGLIDTSCLLHRRHILGLETWSDDGKQNNIDWDLVERWLRARIRWSFVREEDAAIDYYG